MLKVTEVSLEEITIPDRSRQNLGDLSQLKDSISKYGVLQPIILDENYVLSAGERRYRACEALRMESIPARIIPHKAGSDRLLIELIENVERQDFSWAEEIELKLKIHEFYSNQHKKWSYRDTCKALNVSIGGLSTDLDLAKAIRHFPELGKLKTKRKALDFSKKLVNKANAVSTMESLPQEDQEKIRRMLRGDQEKPASQEEDSQPGGASLSSQKAAERIIDICEVASARETPSSSSQEPTLKFLYQISSWQSLLKKLPSYIGFAEIDPPYAIDFTKTYYNASEAESDADWTVDQLKEELKALLSQLYPKMLDCSWVLVWSGTEHTELVNSLALAAGFSVQRPGIWVKPGGSVNRTQTTLVSNYETYVLLSKGQAAFNVSHMLAAISYAPVHASQKFHQWQKPLDLYKYFLNGLGRENTLFFSPFAGSGMSMVAATLYGMVAIGSDLTQKYFYEFYQTISEYGNVQQLDLSDL